MTNISTEQIKKIASLSRIDVSETNLEALANQLNNIVGWIQKLNEVTTDSVKTLTNVHDISLITHIDVVDDGKKCQEVLQNSKYAKYQYYSVPKVIE